MTRYLPDSFFGRALEDLDKKQPLDPILTEFVEMEHNAGHMHFSDGDNGFLVVETYAYGRQFLEIEDAAEALAHIGAAAAVHTHTISDVTGLQAELNSKPTLDGSGLIPVSKLPAIAITTVQTAANQTAMLALTTQEGDVVVRTDQNLTYIRNAGTSGTISDFTQLLFPSASVSSVFGRTGAVAAASGDYNTSQVTENTNLYFTNARAQAAAKMVSATTTLTGAFPLFKTATVSSGTAVFHLTTDGTSSGAAIFPNGADLNSVQLCAVDDGSPCAYGSPTLSNGGKTMTVTVNRSVGVTVLGLTVLGAPTAANGVVVRLSVFGN